jgi:hypothetical protein
MLDLDSFISAIPGFDGDIPIPVIPALTSPPGDESDSDPYVDATANASKTQARKQKAADNLTPQIKAKKPIGKSPGRNKINEPIPKASGSTPPSGPW